jgi:hypothetical protein
MSEITNPARWKRCVPRGDFHGVVHFDLNDSFNYENFPKFRMGRRMADQYPAIPFKTEFNTTPLRKDNQCQIGKSTVG